MDDGIRFRRTPLLYGSISLASTALREHRHRGADGRELAASNPDPFGPMAHLPWRGLLQRLRLARAPYGGLARMDSLLRPMHWAPAPGSRQLLPDRTTLHELGTQADDLTTCYVTMTIA